MALAERLGATVNLSFSKDDPFDFCVAKTVNSPKYLLARARGVPAATPAWLRDSAAAGAFLPLDGPDVPGGYRPPPFAGLSVCVTGHSQDARAEIESRVVAGGGAYASDLVKGVCTHLVAADTTSAKYAHAARWDGVRIVTEAWVRACVDERARADETKFSLAAGDASGDASGRKTRNDAQTADAAEDDAQTSGDVPNERDVPWGSCFLLSARVCLRGFERDSEEHARALRVVRRAGAGTVSNPAKATHVVVPDDPPLKELKELKELRDRVVHLTWLEACEAEARVADLRAEVRALERRAARDRKRLEATESDLKFLEEVSGALASDADAREADARDAEAELVKAKSDADRLARALEAKLDVAMSVCRVPRLAFSVRVDGVRPS